MTATAAGRLAFLIYLALFFAVLLLPLAIMGITAFNVPAYPQVLPFEGPTLRWFAELASDAPLIEGLLTSLRIGVLVVALSLVLGLAGAMLLHQGGGRWLYVLLIAPILTPGVVIGIGTVVFWRDLSRATGLIGAYDGMLLTVFAQTSFIASYCMLILSARLNRLDPALEEAARDLGASPLQSLRHVVLPHLRPALVTAGFLAFLSSVENYNATTFAILADKTFTTVLYGKIRLGLSPAISALAVLMILATLLLIGLTGMLRKTTPSKDRVS
ncbi:MAG: ABC transporter permease subunit [Paracoccus aminovorans]|nr:ABC transporter permease subunit [Paracoccus aminovorans]